MMRKAATVLKKREPMAVAAFARTIRGKTSAENAMVAKFVRTAGEGADARNAEVAVYVRTAGEGANASNAEVAVSVSTAGEGANARNAEVAKFVCTASGRTAARNAGHVESAACQGCDFAAALSAQPFGSPSSHSLCSHSLQSMCRRLLQCVNSARDNGSLHLCSRRRRGTSRAARGSVGP
jgi:hypothetical protein